MNYWIYFNERSQKWEVKQWLERGVRVVKEYTTRSEAFRFAAYGIS